MDKLSLLAPFLHGAEGEEDESKEQDSKETSLPPTGGKKDEGSTSTSTASTSKEDKGKEESDAQFSKEYVEKLRKENAGLRVQAKELEDRKKAELSELERAQAEAQEEKVKREQLEATLKREQLSSAILVAASQAKFADPGDAITLLDLSTISVDEETGKPNTNSVKAAVDRLAKTKPYLLAATSGSGDGGARGGTKADARQQYDKKFQEEGRVPMPA